MTQPTKPRIRIGGKTYDSLNDLPPESRQKLEKMMEQMRASGALEDKNRDGVPDRFESMLKVVGWIGKLTGKPQLRDQLTRQMQEQLRAFGAAPASPRPPTGSSAGSSSAPALPTRPSAGPSSTPTAPTRPSAGPASASATPLPRASTPRTATKSPPAMVSSNQDPRTESAGAEFIRKLVIVSVLVGLGYLAFRLLGS